MGTPKCTRVSEPCLNSHLPGVSEFAALLLDSHSPLIINLLPLETNLRKFLDNPAGYSLISLESSSCSLHRHTQGYRCIVACVQIC